MAPTIGCVSAPDGTPGPDVAPGGRERLPWGLTECTFLNWFPRADPARIAERLPEGFLPRESGGPFAALGSAYLGFEAFRCREAVGLNETLTDLDYGSFFTGIDPPDELRVPEVEDNSYYFKWDVLVPDEPRRGALADAGLPARAGSTDVSWDPASALYAARLTLDGVGEFRFTGATSDTPFEDDPMPAMEFSPATRGLATWRATIVNATLRGGQGAWQAPAGSWPAEVLGATEGHAFFITGTWTFEDAWIELPR